MTFISTTLATAAAVLTLSENVYHNFINAIRSEVTIVIVYAVIKYYNITLTANGIDATMRGVLEQYIDSIVIAIPNIVRVFFDASKKAQLQIQNEKDFALGVGLGNIQNAFLTTFVSTQARYSSPEELTQIGNVIFKRIPEIRDAIFSAG